MNDSYLLLRLVHILASTVLFGTGLGTAFSMWRAQRGGDVKVIAAVTRNVVLADWVFTTPAVIVQPLSGLALVALAGHPLTAPWLVVSLILFAIVGLCWLPVVWLQLRMRDLAAAAVRDGRPLPVAYHRHFRAWFALGWPAFLGVIAIFWLMVWKPALWA